MSVDLELGILSRLIDVLIILFGFFVLFRIRNYEKKIINIEKRYIATESAVEAARNYIDELLDRNEILEKDQIFFEQKIIERDEKIERLEHLEKSTLEGKK